MSDWDIILIVRKESSLISNSIKRISNYDDDIRFIEFDMKLLSFLTIKITFQSLKHLYCTSDNVLELLLQHIFVDMMWSSWRRCDKI